MILVAGGPEHLPDDYCGALGTVPKPYDSQCFAEIFTFVARVREAAASPLAPLQLAPWLHRVRGLEPA